MWRSVPTSLWSCLRILLRYWLTLKLVWANSLLEFWTWLWRNLGSLCLSKKWTFLDWWPLSNKWKGRNSRKGEPWSPKGLDFMVASHNKGRISIIVILNKAEHSPTKVLHKLRAKTSIKRGCLTLSHKIAVLVDLIFLHVPCVVGTMEVNVLLVQMLAMGVISMDTQFWPSTI